MKENQCLKDAYGWGMDTLKKAGVTEYAIDAFYLLEFVTGVSRGNYYANPEAMIGEEDLQKYQSLIQKRSRKIPLQHLTMEQEFMGLKFYVNEDVLIPRQDSETLVEEALGEIENESKVLDMCTGSGCLLLSLLKHTRKKNVEGTGVDISPDALRVAKRNAENLGVDAVFFQSDLFQQVEGRFQMILSNPPYIRKEEINSLEEEVKIHDPMLALDGGEDGLDFYRRIIEMSPNHLTEEGILIFEIGYDQADDVVQLLKMKDFHGIVVKKDLTGLDRVVKARYNGSDE
ncbi:release factor glutamine methyltransferase [Aequitasia blattaphilus]|uniref:Release factor glutamine methyltransferase n=1 Tax=Aequitasia blattaphilus TaxID=2949332 RepID=A0ABT1E9D3_9FIRM|nr:peptide chain release factor N(5)-glutamine methyltransferase [Aequitasia blattaphilus]MCP1102296.1 peptide chain release factor N(5)-glutamine methyltransferase [Aequitasia blattaphilus]MCR8614936.1 peptide chain release factor N(5)-glutamine methyltransferase [Aequitasia blattaphilus]